MVILHVNLQECVVQPHLRCQSWKEVCVEEFDTWPKASVTDSPSPFFLSCFHMFSRSTCLFSGFSNTSSLPHDFTKWYTDSGTCSSLSETGGQSADNVMQSHPLASLPDPHVPIFYTTSNERAGSVNEAHYLQYGMLGLGCKANRHETGAHKCIYSLHVRHAVKVQIVGNLHALAK